MGQLLRMPRLAVDGGEGTLVAWHVEVGDDVSAGDVVAAVAFGDADGTVAAPESGVVRRTFLAPGDSAAAGTPLGIVAGETEDVSDLEAEAEGARGDAAVPDAENGEPPATDAASTDESPATDAASTDESPATDAASTDGTGGDEPPADEASDDEEATDESAAAEARTADLTGPAATTLAEERPFSGMRRTIADRLGESYRNAVHVTEHRTADAEELFAAVDAADAVLDVDVSLPDVLLVALSATLSEHPAFNATFEDGTHRLYEEHNVGVAVDVEAGLLAPVVPDVGGRSLREVALARREMTRRAREGDFSMADLSNGTFTVTNLGVLGVESFDPVINPPQVAILGVNAVAERPVADGRGGVTVRRRLPLDLSFDHRVVDGADAARFLGTLVAHLENPWPLLPEAVREAGESLAAGESEETPERYAVAHSEDGLAGTVTAGEAEWSFGDDATPVDMYAGSLASCITVFLRLRADEEGISLGTVDVAAEVHPKDGDVERVAVDVTLDSDAPDDTLDRVVDYAEQDCYVRRALREDVDVDVSWTVAE